jgi:hypothetical protein
MANEFIAVTKPADDPRGSSVSYKRQNTYIFALATGIDKTSPYIEEDAVVIPEGGVIDVNGVLYITSSDVRLPIQDRYKTYYIKLVYNEQLKLTPVLTEQPGIFIPSKYGMYTEDNERLLDFVVSGLDGPNIFLHSGIFLVPKGVNHIWLTGCAHGENGTSGSAGTSSGTYSGGKGGRPGEYCYRKRIEVRPGEKIPVVIGETDNSDTYVGSIIFHSVWGNMRGGGGLNAGLGTVGGGSIGQDYTVNGRWEGGTGGTGALGNYGLVLESTNGEGYTNNSGIGGAYGGGGGGGSYGDQYGVYKGGNGGYGSGGGGGGAKIGSGSGGQGGLGGPAIIKIEY